MGEWRGGGAREALAPPPTFLLNKQHFLCYFIKTKLQMGTLTLSNTMLPTLARLFNNVKKNLFTCCFSVLFKVNPVGIYLFKVNNRNTRTRCEICSRLTIKTSERCHWHSSGVFIVNFNHFHTLF